jgi:hypothetical protein
MKLKDFIAQLQKLEQEGHGEKQVFYRRSSSGDCGELNSAHITDHLEDTGPFDLEEGEEYVSVSAGN